MQKILTVSTESASLRAAIVGWSHNDGDCVQDAYQHRIGTKNEYRHPNDIPVGLCGGSLYRIDSYPTVLHAIGDGWKLLAPPREYSDRRQDSMGNPFPVEMYEWWLVKE